MRIQRRSYLEQNAGAVDVELTQGNLERIDAELPKPAGERYNEAGMAGVSLQGRRCRRADDESEA
jgi:hypothetical protein